MKKTLAVVMAAAMMLGLVACGGGSQQSTTAAAAPAQTTAAAAETKAAETQAAPAATEAAAPEASGEADIIRCIQSYDPGTFEPGNNDEQGYNRIMTNIYDSLFRYDENGELEGRLCEEYEWDDNTHLRLHIREGVKFSDGSDLTAEDVVWTIQRSIEDALPNYHFNIIDGPNCTVEDDHTCVLALKYPCASMPSHLASPECAIASKKAFEESNGDYLGGAIVGSGPYKLVEYVQGDRVLLTANEYYWEPGIPKVKDLEIRIITSGESAAVEAKTLQYDVVQGANAREFDVIDQIDGVHIEYGQTAKTVYLLLNMKKAPMDNPLVREAFARAINVVPTAKLAYGATAHPAEAFIVPGIAGCNPETYRKYYGEGADIETAKQLLAEAGYPNGVDLEITVPSNDTTYCDMGEAIQAQVAECGINLSVNKMENATMREYIDGGNHHMCIYGFTAQTMEADGFISQIQPGSGALARVGYERQEFFDRYQEGCSELDAEKRAAIWEECLEMLMEDYTMVPLNHLMNGAAVKDNVQGFWWAKDYEEIYPAYWSK